MIHRQEPVRDEQIRAAVHHLSNTMWGEVLLNWMASECFAFDSTMTPDPMAMAFNEGRRSVFLEITGMLSDEDPDRIPPQRPTENYMDQEPEEGDFGVVKKRDSEEETDNVRIKRRSGTLSVRSGFISGD